MRRESVVAIAFFLALAYPRPAAALRGVRPLFEPTDLELEAPGIAELDVQLGLIHGREPWRLVVPDFELDVGVLRNLEIDIDGAYALEASEPGSFRFANAVPDNLWLAAKVGIFDWGDVGAAPGDGDAWAIGLQAGPKLPIAPGSGGLGVEGIVLVGHLIYRSHFVMNAGGFYDPTPAVNLGRPRAFEAGLAFDRDLDLAGRFQVMAAVAAVRFIDVYPNQLTATAGLGWSPNQETQLTVTGLCGFFAGSDRYGALLGISQKVRLFGKTL